MHPLRYFIFCSAQFYRQLSFAYFLLFEQEKHWTVHVSICYLSVSSQFLKHFALGLSLVSLASWYPYQEVKAISKLFN